VVLLRRAKQARKLMRAGESFRFRAAVKDARGCPLSTRFTWQLQPEGSVGQLDGGTLVLPSDAADAQLTVVATVASRAVEVVVDVVSDERYTALLASGEFDADGATAAAAMATITSGSIGAQTAAVETDKQPRKWTFVALVSVIALVFAGGGVVLLRRAKQARKLRERQRLGAGVSKRVVFTGEGAARTVLEPGANPLFKTQLESPPSEPPAARSRWVCPSCGTLYEDEALEVCPKDATRLLPVNA
jgi:hypothetical protein